MPKLCTECEDAHVWNPFPFLCKKAQPNILSGILRSTSGVDACPKFLFCQSKATAKQAKLKYLLIQIEKHAIKTHEHQTDL